MAPTIAELMQALPETIDEREVAEAEQLPDLLRAWSLRPVPVGWFHRLRLLGTLQAKIGVAYLFHWIRGWFNSADENKRLLAETHWRTALRLLDSMTYLRGAAMKVGQTLANFPDIVPAEFVDTLDRLHFEAPPMHWSLLREMVCNELGDDPENLFASFDKRAFAAASLGQVHRARLKTGEEVAVKIQYPGIARTIRDDFRNLLLVLLPARLGRDWENVKEQCDDLRMRMEQETDYEQEAEIMQKVRPLYREDDRIVIPRVYPQYSTARVLTMERLEGVHLGAFLARNPSQEVRNDYARKTLRAWYRMLFVGRMLYADFHPGNLLFMDDGRLGVIDFGFVMKLDDETWGLFRRMDRALTTGKREDRVAAIKEWSWITDEIADRERLELSVDYADWCWRSRYCGGEFDFGDEADFRQGIDLFTKMVSKRYSRARACTPVISRCQFAWRAILYQLKAKIDVRELAEQEVKGAGWDRSEYTARSEG